MRNSLKRRKMSGLLAVAGVLLLIAVPAHALTTLGPTTSTPGVGANFAQFTTLFPGAPAAFSGTLPVSGFLGVGNATDSFWADSGTTGRIQSAAYAGVGAAAGKFAYVYQVDCSGGNVNNPDFHIPIPAGMSFAAGVLPGPAGETFWQLSTVHPDVGGSTQPNCGIGACFADPNLGTTGPETLFNLSEFGSLGGGDDDGFDSVLAGASSIAASIEPGGVFWSSPLLVFITDVAPGLGFVTIDFASGFGETENRVVAVVPGGGGVPCAPGECITPPGVPMPATLVLLGLGLLSVGALRLRRR